ncbi:Armadillo-type fold domain containing protein [Pseudohyphozyma bogoriensis]|nr:Armadillo-type fold domain containing protein [Pseudohyphozyma bogoriensis]
MADLVSTLNGWEESSSPSLTVQLRPCRLALRDSPSLKHDYTAQTGFWEAVTRVWKIHAEWLQREDGKDAIEGVQTLAGFALALTSGQGVGESQKAALDGIEPHLRDILLASSSFMNLQDAAYTPMTRVCVQLLSNLITANPALCASYFPRRIEEEEKDEMISRLLATTDAGTILAILVFLLNATTGSLERGKLLASTFAGSAILDRLLSQASAAFDDEEADTSKDEVFNLTFGLIRQLITLDVFPDAYKAQSSISTYAITTSQLTLLKFLDGFLALPSLHTPTTVPFLLSLLTKLTNSLSKEKAREQQRVMDGRDAAAFQGIVLVLQMLTSIGLGSEKGRKEVAEPEGVVEDVCRLLAFAADLSNTLRQGGVVEEGSEAVGLLKLCAVRMLGVLSFENTDGQDRIREAGGLNLLLGMCQIDGTNPTLREHALFSVRSVLKNNLKNQDLVEGMKPQFVVGPQGELQDLPPALRGEDLRN